mmetsp:Transcript_55985/g.126310  ORF Transcript_55985/g.126310 Transcript_55985/m.126310 type:complete len:312 (-) Transcript_55985:238-1173(-)
MPGPMMTMASPNRRISGARPGRRRGPRCRGTLAVALLVAVPLHCLLWRSPLGAGGQARGPATALLLPRPAGHVDRGAHADRQTKDLVVKVAAAAAQGLVAAVVAAFMAAFEEPIMNRLLVERITLAQALRTVRLTDCLNFFLVTCPLNMLKFPFFEAVSAVLSFTGLTHGTQGAITGWVFCTCMLPFTNIRFRKSLQMPIDRSVLYQAYPPTVLRDITYGWSRGFIALMLLQRLDWLAASSAGQILIFGLTVSLACIVSSPFNEWRGYWLQDPKKKLSFWEFFRPEFFIRSTIVTSVLMGLSLMVGMAIVR